MSQLAFNRIILDRNFDVTAQVGLVVAEYGRGLSKMRCFRSVVIM